MANGPAGRTGPRKGPSRKEIEQTYDRALDRFIRENQDKKQQQSSVKSVIADMPQKFQDFIDRNTKDGKMNEAAKAIFRQYDDGRTQYSRDMGRMVQKSPEFAAARARRFPIETFIEKMAPAVVGVMTGLPIGLGSVYDEARKLGSATIGGLKSIAQKKGIIPKDNINPNTGTTSVKTDVINPAATSRVTPTADSIFTGVMPTDPQPTAFTGVPPTDPQPTAFTGVAPTGPQPTMFTGATPSDPQFFSRFTGRTPTDPGPVQQALPTDAITEGLKSLFTGETPTNRDFSGTQQQPFDPPMIPGGIPRGSLPIREGRLLGRDPNVDYGQELNLLDIIADDLNTRGEPQTSSSDFLINQAKTLNAPGLDNEIQLAELNPSQRAVLDQRANRFAFDQGLATPEDMLNKIRPLDKSGIFGFFGNEANLQDIVDFYRNNPTVTMAEGGLASINNPQYNMLMKASDFDI
jgi:hypothetical protein